MDLVNIQLALDDDIAELKRGGLLVLKLRTADGTVPLEAFSGDNVLTKVEEALDLVGAGTRLQVVFGGETIYEGTFAENGIDDSATLEAHLEDIWRLGACKIRQGGVL